MPEPSSITLLKQTKNFRNYFFFTRASNFDIIMAQVIEVKSPKWKKHSQYF
jgi:hypothetical protein